MTRRITYVPERSLNSAPVVNAGTITNATCTALAFPLLDFWEEEAWFAAAHLGEITRS